MRYTYKLDSRGIPYRVAQKETKQEPVRDRKSRLFSNLLPHSGLQRTFQLYVF